MAIQSFNKAARRALALMIVAALASVAMAASNVKVVGAKPMANTVVVTLKNSGSTSASGTVVVTALAADGRLMQSAAVVSVAAGSQASATVVFDANVGSITGTYCGAISDNPDPI